MMNTQIKSTFVLLLALLGTACRGQQTKQSNLNELPDGGGGAQAQPGDVSRYRTIRIFEDPSTHLRWTLLQNLSRPAVPARLIRASNNPNCAATSAVECGLPGAVSFQPAADPVIHVGDALIIAEHTQVLDAQLEATALGQAAAGEPLRVRLKSSGHILFVVADGPGRATMHAGTREVRP